MMGSWSRAAPLTPGARATAPASGAGGRRFESSHSDHYRERPLTKIRGLFSWGSGPGPVHAKLSFASSSFRIQHRHRHQ
jgi:hypothetical protein